MNVEIGTEAMQFTEKEYINGIFLAVYPIVTEWNTCGVSIHLPGGIQPTFVRMLIKLN
jgi:hypothetical protein